MTRGETEAVTEAATEDRDGAFEDQAMLVAGKTMSAPSPRITAFIWGGKVRPHPTLPFGRWKEVA